MARTSFFCRASWRCATRRTRCSGQRWCYTMSPAFGSSTRPRPTWWPRSEKTDRKSTRLNSSHSQISYAVFCLKKKSEQRETATEHNAADLPFGAAFTEHEHETADDDGDERERPRHRASRRALVIHRSVFSRSLCEDMMMSDKSSQRQDRQHS